MVASPKRGEVYWVALDPTLGAEMQKTRPALIVSPDDLNRYLPTVIVAPITSTLRNYPFRLECRVRRKKGSIALDQLRSIDRARLGKRIATIDVMPALTLLCEMFAP